MNSGALRLIAVIPASWSSENGEYNRFHKLPRALRLSENAGPPDQFSECHIKKLLTFTPVASPAFIINPLYNALLAITPTLYPTLPRPICESVWLIFHAGYTPNCPN